MADPKTVRLDTDHQSAIEDMIEEGDADTHSEAIRQTSRAQLAREGHLAGSGGTGYWAWALRRMAFASMYAGLGAIAIFYFMPLSIRFIAVVPMLAGIICLVTSRAIEAHQPITTPHIPTFANNRSK